MKGPIFVFTVVAVLLGGCSPKPDPRDARIAKLEKDVEAMRDIILNHLTEVTNLMGKLPEMCANVALPLYETNLREIGELRYVTTNTAAVVYQLASAKQRELMSRPPSNSANRDAVPPAVRAQIAAEAARMWPGDYYMQTRRIEQQLESYQQLKSNRR